MPELPDLQVFSGNLNRRLKGKKLTRIEVPVAKKLNVSKAALRKALVGASIRQVYRDGKELHIKFSNGNVLGLHLMLHGGLDLFEHEEQKKHCIIALYFKNGVGLAMSDWQKSATPKLNPADRDAPDALARTITLSFLKNLLQTKTIIKKVLLDQHLVRGIGNAYADEILWVARISPFSISNKIPADAIKKLKASIKKVLTNAEKQIRKQNPDVISGEIRDFLVIHNAKRSKSPTGGKILQKTIGGRKTYYTSEQKLYK